MTDRPILFSAPMVRALLEGRKTQTRRLLTPTNARFGSLTSRRLATEFWREHASWPDVWLDGKPEVGQYLHVPAHHMPVCKRCWEMGWEGTAHRLYPIIEVGDRLWVREACYIEPGTTPDARDDDAGDVLYRADGDSLNNGPDDWASWRPSIHMPRWVSRLTLTVTSVQVQRLQDLSEGEAIAEGVERRHTDTYHGFYRDYTRSQDDYGNGTTFARDSFRTLWNSINAERPGASWSENPWVVALTFSVAVRNIDALQKEAA